MRSFRKILIVLIMAIVSNNCNSSREICEEEEDLATAQLGCKLLSIQSTTDSTGYYQSGALLECLLALMIKNKCSKESSHSL